jgi:hypothetical protein
VGEVDDRADRVDGTGVDVARLSAHDHRPALRGQCAAQRVHPHSALVVGLDHDDRVGAEAEEPERPVDGVVPVGAREDAERWRAGETAFLDVPAGAAQHLVPGGGERGEVGHLRAGDEPDGRVPRQAEEVEQPAAGDLLDRGGGRAHRVEAGVLVPGGGEPVGGERGGRDAADHETEVPAAAGGDQSGRGRGRERGDHVGGRCGRLRNRAAERGPHRGRIDRDAHRTAGQPGQVGERVPVRLAERCFPVGHLHVRPLSFTTDRGRPPCDAPCDGPAVT